ncbi:SDR family oxidoreductase [Longimicrobium sp.]|uniref:SDR family oxidoreductase n=1 Tax=Longimicrobium sp. TaxID=2029185 RepID=UPI003B3B5228
MRVLITGGGGLLGGELIRQAPSGIDVHATRRTSPVQGAISHAVELSDGDAVEALWMRVRPDFVIHTAYTQAEGERDVWRATESVVRACRASGAALVYMSTDALLDGESSPYAESAEPAPVHEYGRWKARAELHVRAEMPEAAVIRTSLIVRAQPPDRNSAWVVDAMRRGDPVRLFTDELRCPVAVEDLAAQLWEVALLPPERRAGVWHLAGPEVVSRYALGVLLALWHGLDPSAIIPALSASAPAPRPRDLRLLTTRADRELRTRACPVSAVLFPPR